MAKQGGLGANLYVGGYDIGGDIQQVPRIGGGPNPLEVTAIDKRAFERIGGIRSGSIQVTTFLDIAAGQEHEILSTLPRTDTQVMFTVPAGTSLAIGDPAAACVAKQVGYDGTRANDGMFTLNVDAESNGYGVEWCKLLTAGKRTDTTGTNGSALDQTTASTSFGWQAYAQVFSVAGTSVTLKIQDSADNSSWADLSGASFTAVLAGAVGFQRLQAASSTATVRRYLRVVSSGTFSSAVFVVAFVRNLTAVSF